MAALTPYTYIQCPCSDPANLSRHSHSDPTTPSGTEELDAFERPFDPRAPRAAYSLYPLEYLLYCEDCHQIRCPRCIAEEIVTYYCPNCLFEVPGSNIKSDGNRYGQVTCARCAVICLYIYICPSATRPYIYADSNTDRLVGAHAVASNALSA